VRMNYIHLKLFDWMVMAGVVQMEMLWGKWEEQEMLWGGRA